MFGDIVGQGMCLGIVRRDNHKVSAMRGASSSRKRHLVEDFLAVKQ